MRTRASIFGVLLSLTACDPTVFDRQREQAPVFVFSTAGGPTVGALGTVLVSYQATVGGHDVSRFAVSGGENAGLGSQFSAFYGFEEPGENAIAEFTRGAIFNGCDRNECGMKMGVSLAAFPSWPMVQDDGTTLLRHGCLAAPALDRGDVQVRCEEASSTYKTVTSGQPGIDLGRSAAGVPFDAHPIGVALFGAPKAHSGAGAVFVMPPGGNLVELDLSKAELGSSLGIGAALAATADRADQMLFATSGSGTVLVGRVELSGDARLVTPLLCVTGGSTFGAALAFAELDASHDGPELVVGEPGEARVAIYPSQGASATCGALEAIRALSCDELECEAGSLFGTSVAAGDFDQDDAADLLIGAPGTDAGAGAVHVLAGEASIANLGLRHGVLRFTGQKVGARLGTGVAALAGRTRPDAPGSRRYEIVASAPGQGTVAIFLCSGELETPMNAAAGSTRGCLPPQPTE
jgi:FG-GAP repeat